MERFQGPMLTYGLHESADIRARNIKSEGDGTSFTLIVSNRKYRVNAPLFGEYNVSNLLAAIATCYQMGYSIESILSMVPNIEFPEGRYQIVENEAPFQIVLDYAHTPDALDNVLEAVHHMPYRKLIVMITGIGLRDPWEEAINGRSSRWKS